MSVTALLAASLVTLAAVLWWPPQRWLLRLRFVPPGAGWSDVATAGTTGPARWAPDLAQRLLPPRPRWVFAAAALATPWLLGSPVSLILLLTVLGVAAYAFALVRRARRRRLRDTVSRRVTQGIDLLAAELRGGSTPALALAGVASECPELVGAARVASDGGDVVAALSSAAASLGAERLSGVAAAWKVAERSGAPVATVLARMAEHARDEEAVAEEIRAESEPARATGRVMALLPAAGLALGSGLGGDPVGVITRTVPGAVCLALGCAFAIAGLAWIERIADAAEDVP